MEVTAIKESKKENDKETREQTGKQGTDALAGVSKEAQQFRDQFMSLHLATCSSDGTPNASYAPFVQLGETQFGIYISELAVHTRNLMDNPRASVMFIEPEDRAQQLFARKRLVYRCDATLHNRGSESFESILTAFKQRFVGIMDHLSVMKDFHVFTLNATHASYVRGFAQAYEFANGELNTVRHTNDKGHDDS